MASEQIVSKIRQKKDVLVLLVSSDDELCARARQTLAVHEGRLRALGFHVSVVDISPKTAVFEELSCVRVPQLRFFSKGKLQHKVVGLFDELIVDVALRVLG